MKYGPEIITLPEVLPLPKEGAAIHLKGHQKDMTLESKGNNLADRAAEEAAKSKQILSLIPVLTPMESITPVYSDPETHPAQERGYPKNTQGWLVNNETKIFIPKNSQWKVIQGLHQATHLGKDALKHLIKNIFDAVNLTATIKQVCQSCIVCAQVNPLPPAQNQSKDRDPVQERTGSLMSHQCHLAKAISFYYCLLIRPPDGSRPFHVKLKER